MLRRLCAYLKMPSHGPREMLEDRLGRFLDLCEIQLPPAAPVADPQSNLREVVDQAWEEEDASGTPEDAAQASFGSMDQVAARGSGTLSFGKYAGYTFEELWKDDHGYAMFILSKAEEDDCSKEFSMFADWAKATHPQGVADPQLFITFGRHKGRGFKEVLEDDPDYCEWIVTEAGRPDGVGQSLQGFADWLMKNGVGR